MNNVNIEKSVLLPIITENKQKHDNIYNAAISEYWLKAEEILNQKLYQVQQKEQINNYLNLDFPQDHSSDYNRAMRMVELSADNIINLTQSEFNQYILNDWNWRNGFLNTSTIYCSGMSSITGSLINF